MLEQDLKTLEDISNKRRTYYYGIFKSGIEFNRIVDQLIEENLEIKQENKILRDRLSTIKREMDFEDDDEESLAYETCY